jgi:photosystem II stability/assembly factor-like uncharacterized protein
MPCAKTGLVFLTPDEAWLSGDCGGVIAGVFLYNSADGGNTWKPVTLPPPADAAAIFTSEDGYCGSTLQPSSADKLALTVTCVTAASGSARSWLYVSSDRGQNWKTTPLPAPYGHLDFAGDTIWLLGQSDYSNAPDIGLYRSTNAGATWQRVLTPGWTGRPNFVDADNGWVLAEAQDVRALVRTTNGGLSWNEVNPVIGE